MLVTNNYARTCWSAFFCIGLFFITVPINGQAPVQQLNLANEAYQKGNFEEAIAVYEAIISEGYQSTALFHNLGNAYFRTGQMGYAALNFQRGLEMSPGDRGLKENLELIRAGFDDPIMEIPEFFGWAWLNRTQRFLGSNGWAVVGTMVFGFGFFFLSRWQMAQKRRLRKQGFIIGVVLLLVSALPFTLAWSAYQQITQKRTAVVVQGSPQLFQAADHRSEVIRVLEPGVTLHIQDQIGDWVKVKLRNGQIGWVTNTDFEKV